MREKREGGGHYKNYQAFCLKRGTRPKKNFLLPSFRHSRSSRGWRKKPRSTHLAHKAPVMQARYLINAQNIIAVKDATYARVAKRKTEVFQAFFSRLRKLHL